MIFRNELPFMVLVMRNSNITPDIFKLILLRKMRMQLVINSIINEISITHVGKGSWYNAHNGLEPNDFHPLMLKEFL